MTSIIQSNRERKSRIDEGLVERLNNAKDKSNTSNETQENKQSSSELRFITDKKEYEEIIRFIDGVFPPYKTILTDNLKYEDGVMKGSNVYIALAVNRYLKSINTDYRIATQAQLEKDLPFVKKYFVDTAIAIRSLTEYKSVDTIQDFSVSNLLNAIEPYGLKEEDLPIAIDLAALHLVASMEIIPFTGLVYHKSESINWRDETLFSATDEFGFPTTPIMIEKPGFRRIYTSEDKIARCMLSENSNIFTSYFKFSSSADEYRIVLAKK